MEPGWDKKEVAKLKELGLNHEQAMTVVGRIAEHRQRADRQGYSRGYVSGYENGLKKHQEHNYAVARESFRTNVRAALEQLSDTDVLEIVTTEVWMHGNNIIDEALSEPND